MSKIRRAVTGKDAALFCVLIAILAWLHASVLFKGRVYFTDDLIHINHPWRVMTAEQLQRGQQPLWNPYSYFGLPLLGMMQTGQFHPLSLIFHFFPFEGALGWFLLANYALGALWTYLWMRRWALSSWASLAGASAFTLGGYALAYLEFPNLLGTVLHLPAFFLFWDCPWLLGLLTASAFFAGYPVFWAASIVALFCVRPLWPSLGSPWPKPCLRSAGGVALGTLLSCLVLLPGLELANVSNRQAGLRSERLGDSMSPMDFTAFIHPELTRFLESKRQPKLPPSRVTFSWTEGGVSKTLSVSARAPDPVKDSSGIKYSPWKSCYVGCVGFLLMLAGFLRLVKVRPLSAAGLALLALCAAVVLMGIHARVSLRLWEHFLPLLYLRVPARFAFLPLAGILPLIAMGVDGLAKQNKRWAPAFAAMLLAELAWTGRGYNPTMPRGYFHQKGAFVEFLEYNLDGDRYFLYPRSDVAPDLDLDHPSEDYQRLKKMVRDTYKQKLFGVSNGVFHFYAASGDYESLFPENSGKVLRLLRNADPKRLAVYLKWAGVRFWFSRDRMQGASLIYQGLHLWQTYLVRGAVSSAYWMPLESRTILEKPFSDAPETMKERAWDIHWPREDRIRVQGRAPEAGLLYLAEPNYPGWEAYVNGKKTALKAAWGAFVACEVPVGQVSVRLLYRPISWSAGLWISLCALAACAAAGWMKWGAWRRSF